MGKYISMFIIALIMVGVGLAILKLMGIIHCSRLAVLAPFLLALTIYVCLLIAAVVMGVEI